MHQEPTRPPLAAAARLCALAASLSGLCLYGVLVLLGAEPGIGMACACAMPGAAIAALGHCSQHDRPHDAVRELAALLLLPLLVQISAWSDDLPVAATVHVLAAMLMLLTHLALFGGVLAKLVPRPDPGRQPTMADLAR